MRRSPLKDHEEMVPHLGFLFFLLLDRLEKKATSLDLDLVQGYITGYLAIITGHRPVVFNSLKKKEVLEAEHEGEGYVVWVSYMSDGCFSCLLSSVCVCVCVCVFDYHMLILSFRLGSIRPKEALGMPRWLSLRRSTVG